MGIRIAAGVSILTAGLAACAISSQASVGADPATIHVPKPRGILNAQLYAVSCHSDRSCVAVGTQSTSHGRFTPLIERWRRSRWSVVRAPVPEQRGLAFDQLLGVSCVSRSDCFAAGFAGSGNSINTLVEHWTGRRWTIMPSPNSDLAENTLNAISCTGPSRCMAVGSSSSSYADGYASDPLIEAWDGRNWSVLSPPSDKAYDTELLGVSCSSSRDCTAVGWSGGGGSPLILRWRSGRWAWTEPDDAVFAALGGVSCPASRYCLAVGEAGITSGSLTYLKRWNGHRWALLRAPSFKVGLLNGVSCAGRTFCVAVGTRIERWDDGRWMQSSTHAQDLYGVSCRETMCMAVGSLRHRHESAVSVLIRAER